MGSLRPANRPQNPQSWFITRINASLEKFGAKAWDGVSLLTFGFAGFYQLMGNPTRNDRMIYDDAIGYITGRSWGIFNGNVDPNGYRGGHGHAEGVKGMGMLADGYYPEVWKIGQHKKIYPALVQRGTIHMWRDADSSVPKSAIVDIDGSPMYSEIGSGQGVDIHPGGVSMTSSIACQTIVPDQWPSFISPVVAEAKRLGNTFIPYLKDHVRG